MTVRGPIDPSEMGVTLAHDHLLCDSWRIVQDYAFILDDEVVAGDELERFGVAGGGTICDPTNVGLGRDATALQRISERTGLHVVMGCGWYRERAYPAYVFEEPAALLTDRLVAELDGGVGDTGIRPGFIGEIGTERFHITPAEERVFRAAARAHRRTGAPIMTHTTHWGELALEQLDLLEEEGVDPAHVIISHLGDRPGVRWLLPVAGRGPWLGIDNLGFVDGYAPLEVRADNVAALWAEGYGERILLSNDICVLDQLVLYGGPGYANVIENFLPLLRDRGLGDAEIHTMCVANPARAFAFSPRLG
jgi:predicted metal-dependent phosphotriesterase family hydrolase